MKNNYCFDKTGVITGLCVIAVGGFIDSLVMILGSLIALSGIVAYLVESYKAKKHMSEELAEEAFFEEVVQKASKVPIR